MLNIYTDGSCLRNPGPGGFAALICNDQEVIIKGGEIESTNNRMELMAIIKALEWFSNNRGQYIGAKIHSDSNLIISTLNKNWKRKKNLDLWQLLEKVLVKLSDTKLEWIWVKGHAGERQNELVDDIARAEAEKIAKMSKKKTSSAKTTPTNKDELFCANCQKSVDPNLEIKKGSGMIKATCPSCKKYLKFVPQTKENIKKAAKRSTNATLF